MRFERSGHSCHSTVQNILFSFCLLFLFLFLFLAQEARADAPGAEYVHAIAEAPKKVFFLTFAGDIMAHTPNYSMPDFSRIYRDITPILSEADLNFANLEFVIDPDRPYSSYPRFNVHPEYVQAAIDAGFSVFSLANNHSADFGPAGIQATVESMHALKEQSSQVGIDIYYSGLRSRAEAAVRRQNYSLEVIPLGRFRIGFVAVAGLLNDWNGQDLVYFPFYDSQREIFIRWLREARQEVDLLIVSFHGGLEYQIQPSPRKQRFLQEIARAGADIVWGHHPHVLQPTEIVPVARVGQPNNFSNSFIIYSAGNFVSSQTWGLTWRDHALPRAFTGDSALYRIMLMEADGLLLPVSIRAIPIAHFSEADDSVSVRPLESLLTGIGISAEQHWYYLHRSQHMRPLRTPPFVQTHIHHR